MSTDVEATWVNAPTDADPPEYQAAELRRADAALVAGDGTSLAVRGGVVLHGPNSLSVAVDGSDNVTIQPGPVIIPGNSGSGVGCYRTALPAAHTEALTARNATNPRIDLVVFRVLDPDVVGTHTERTGRVQIIAGTPAGVPAVPALPSLAVELARITVPATGGGSATVDLSKRTFAAAAGGRLLVTTAAQLPVAAAPWQRAVALDTGDEYVWDPTASGGAGAWDDGTYLTFNPTLVNWTLSNGTLAGRYRRDGKNVDVEIDYTVGSSDTKSGGLVFGALPFAAAAGADQVLNGTASIYDTSTGDLKTRIPFTTSGNASRLNLRDTSGNLVNNTTPMTFATGDIVRVRVRYRIA